MWNPAELTTTMISRQFFSLFISLKRIKSSSQKFIDFSSHEGHVTKSNNTIILLGAFERLLTSLGMETIEPRYEDGSYLFTFVVQDNAANKVNSRIHFVILFIDSMDSQPVYIRSSAKQTNTIDGYDCSHTLRLSSQNLIPEYILQA